MLGIYYKTIKEAPVKARMDIDTQDYKSLRKFKFFGTKKNDLRAYERLMNDYISVFGLSEDFTKLWERKKRLAKLNTEYLKDFVNNRFLLTEIEILTKELEEIEKKQTKSNTMTEMVAQLIKDGATIDINKHSWYFVETLIRNGNRG